MFRLLLVFLSGVLLLSSCTGKFVKPIWEYHNQLARQPGQNIEYNEYTGLMKPWAVGQYVRYLTKGDNWQALSEWAITGTEGDAFWLEMKFTGHMWGYKYLVKLVNSMPTPLADFFKQKIKIVKGYYYHLDSHNNQWISSEEKDGLPVSYFFMTMETLGDILAKTGGYDPMAMKFVDAKLNDSPYKVPAGSFKQTLDFHCEATFSKSTGLVDRDNSFYLHSSVPIFGAVEYDAFYSSVDLIEIRDDFKGTLFVPYPVKADQ